MVHYSECLQVNRAPGFEQIMEMRSLSTANTQVLPSPLHITLLGYFSASIILIPLQLYFVTNSLLSIKGLA